MKNKRICNHCGEEIVNPTGNGQKYHKECFILHEKEYQKEWQKEYYKKPEVKERQREYNKRPEVKERKREYSQIPEVKERKRKSNLKRYLLRKYSWENLSKKEQFELIHKKAIEIMGYKKEVV